MRTRMLLTDILALLAVALFFSAPPLGAQPKGERTTITGEAVDLWCFLEAGDRGAAKKACATACAKAGNPIGIVDARGNLYVTAGSKDHQPAQALLLTRMNSEVTVSGIVVKNGGLQMIYIDSVK